MTAGHLDLRAERWTPFIYDIDFEGFDFTGGSFKVQVRQNRDDSGSALIDLAGATAGSQGVSASKVTVDGITTTTLRIQIDEATIEGVLPASSNGRPADDRDVPLVWDLHVTPSGGIKTRWVEGSFTIVAGVTQ